MTEQDLRKLGLAEDEIKQFLSLSPEQQETLEELMREQLMNTIDAEPQAVSDPPEEQKEPFDPSIIQEGYVFHGFYPPEAAFYCNASGEYYIEETTTIPEEEWLEDGSNREFTVRRQEKYEPTPEELAEQAKAEAKRQAMESRAEGVEAIRVELNGNVYDGNEIAQQRMSRVVQTMPEEKTVEWVMADNSVKMVPVSDLRLVLAQAVEKQVALWPEPYKAGE